MPANGQNSSSFFGNINLFNNALGTTTYSQARQATISAAIPAPSVPPETAQAAPNKTKDVFTGLCAALNAEQLRLATEKKYLEADVYEIEFGSGLGSSVLKKPGSPNYSQTATTNPTSAKAVKDTSTTSVDFNSRTINVTAGTQIVQLIDEIMRGSSYITDQQLYIVDEETQQVRANPKKSGGQVAWYKISVQATQLKYDENRKDHAYRMKFLITPYAINSMQSDWFPPSRFRGTHKSYKYWFTGENKDVLSYEQDYNALYRLIMSGPTVTAEQKKVGFRDQPRRISLPTSENHSKGADGYTNEAGDNAADFLYNPTDLSQCKLRIIGDPAWLQQGEVTGGVNKVSFSYAPFDATGGINYDSQEVVFGMSFNKPSDYNFNTGLVEVTGQNLSAGEAQESSVFAAIGCKSTFRNGRFEQELEGKLLSGLNGGDQNRVDTTRTTTAAAQLDNGSRPATITTAEQIVAEQNASFNYNTTDGSEQTKMLAAQDAGFYDESNQPTPQPAAPPKPATSNGDIGQLSFGAVANNISAGVTTFNNNLNARLTGFNNPPQNMNKET
jgi:hypothetical protein